jgi:hypothetical protein
MVIKTVVNYTQDEINSMINILHLMSDILNDQAARADMQTKANNAFEDVADLLCLDEDGELAFHRQGW